MTLQQFFCTRCDTLIVPLCVSDLGQVIRYRLGKGRFFLQFRQDRQSRLVFLLFVQAISIVILTTHLVAVIRLAQLTEINRRTTIVLRQQVSVPPIERVVGLVFAAKGFVIDLLQHFDTLFVLPFLNLQYGLHELHLVRKRGVRKLLQVGLQITLQRFVPYLKPSRERVVTRLHLRRLSESRRY